MTTTTNKGFVYGWASGDNGWGNDNNENIQRADAYAYDQWGNDVDNTSGLSYGYEGGVTVSATGVIATVAGGQVVLTNNATNYVERTHAGVVSANTSGFTTGALPMAVVVTSGGAITAGGITDRRVPGTQVPSTSGFVAQTLADAKGDILAATAADTFARLAVGSNGQRIKAASGETTGLLWVDEHYTVPFVIDGGGSAITTGLKGGLQVDVAGTIVAATVLALDGLTGDIVVDIWKDTYANHPPTVADTITASAKPTISGGVKATDATLTGWTTGITAGDVLFFNVDSVATFTRVLVSLKVKKS